MHYKKAESLTRSLVSNEIKKNMIVPMLVMLEEIQENTSMSDEDFKYYRKIILDKGNNTKRSVDNHLGRVSINW